MPNGSEGSFGDSAIMRGFHHRRSTVSRGAHVLTAEREDYYDEAYFRYFFWIS